MDELVEGRTAVADGQLSYFRWENPGCSFHILFIHGLGDNKNWFPPQFGSHSLDAYSWLVPDLLGHGKSSKPQLQDAYTMDNQARNLAMMLAEERVKHLVILAHSMGGAVAVPLIEHLSQASNIRTPILFYLEGNLDINDAYLSGKFARYAFDEYVPKFNLRLERIKDSDPGLYSDMKGMGPFPYWASSVDLLRVSQCNELLPRLQKQENLRTYFVFGAENKDRFSSEELIKDAELPLIYIPDAGHMMYRDNPEVFWEEVSSRLEGLKTLPV